MVDGTIIREADEIPGASVLAIRHFQRLGVRSLQVVCT